MNAPSASVRRWTFPQDGKDHDGNCSPVANNRVVFNIAGNKHRLIVAFAYRQQWGFIKFIGTHAEYDQIDVATVDQFR